MDKGQRLCGGVFRRRGNHVPGGFHAARSLCRLSPRGLQWDGEYAPIAQNGVAVDIFMAQGDEYYGPQRAREAYEGLHAAYVEAGWSEEKIDSVLRIQTPDEAWFAERGVTGNYHGGGNVVFEEESILN